MKPSFTRILVPTDFSDPSDAALEYAKTLAERFGASLHLVHVFEDPFTIGAVASEMYVPLPPDARDDMIADARKRLVARVPDGDGARLFATTSLVTGVPAHAIVEYATANQMDLIVMGTHGRGGFAHLLMGSVAEYVVRTAPCPVLTVHSPAVAARVSLASKAVVSPAAA
jgi:nucleotide-binding universal stress UspA family protein